MAESPTILHVEDNPDNRLLVRRLLNSEGYNVVETGDPRLVQDVIRSCHPDLILMDINMPVIDGYTLTNQIKAIPEFSKIPVIALTANVMRGDRERSMQAGCDGYIEKPIDIDTFLEQVARFLQR